MLAWYDCELAPDKLDALVQELIGQAHEDTRGLWETRIGRPTSYDVSDLLKCWSGPRGGINGDYSAAFFHSGNKCGWHLDLAHDRLLDLMRDHLVPQGVQVTAVCQWHEYSTRPGAVIEYDSAAAAAAAEGE